MKRTVTHNKALTLDDVFVSEKLVKVVTEKASSCRRICDTTILLY